MRASWEAVDNEPLVIIDRKEDLAASTVGSRRSARSRP